MGITIIEYFTSSADKQQELDIPSLRTDDVKPVEQRMVSKKRSGTTSDNGAPNMSHISGAKRPLSHANSFTGEKLPKHGVETRFEAELGEVRIRHF